MSLFDYTYLPIDLKVSESLLEKFSSEILLAPEESWYWSSYRQCRLLPLYTGGGFYKEEEMSKHDLSFKWTEPAKKMTTLISWIETELFAWMDPKPRINVIRSKPGAEIVPHIDCSEADYNLLQHKLRIVCQGNKDTLYFLKENGEKAFVTGSHPAYIIDGSHCHGMSNLGDQEKITLCFGNPWNGQQGSFYEDLLSKSADQFSHDVILRTKIGRPYSKEWFKK